MIDRESRPADILYIKVRAKGWLSKNARDAVKVGTRVNRSVGSKTLVQENERPRKVANMLWRWNGEPK